MLILDDFTSLNRFFLIYNNYVELKEVKFIQLRLEKIYQKEITSYLFYEKNNHGH